MDLLELLEVNRDWLPHESWVAVRRCGRAWDQLGCPTKPAALIEFLDQALKLCVRDELRYPKIFLKRLVQLRRGDWKPPSLLCSSRLQTDEDLPQRTWEEERGDEEYE